MRRQFTLSNYHWALLANLVQVFFSWLLLFTVIRLGSKQDVGLFSYLQAVLLPLQLFFTLKLRTIQCSDVQCANEVVEYHRVRQIAGASFLVLSLVLLLILNLPEASFFAGLFFVLSYVVYILRETYVAEFQRALQNQNFFVVNASSALSSSLLFILLYFFSENLVLSLAGLVFGRVISYAVVERIVYFRSASGRLEQFRKKPKAERVKSLFGRAWPLGFAALLGSLFTSIPKILIESDLGLESLADYSAVTSLLVAYNLLISSFVQSALPDAAKMYSVDRIKFFRMMRFAFRRLFLVTLFVGSFFYFFGTQFLVVVFGDEYGRLEPELLFVVLSGAFLSVFSIANLMLSSQQTYFLQLPVYAVTAGLIYLLAEFVVRDYGLQGVILSQAIAYLAGAVLSFVVFGLRARSCG